MKILIINIYLIFININKIYFININVINIYSFIYITRNIQLLKHYLLNSPKILKINLKNSRELINI